MNVEVKKEGSTLIVTPKESMDSKTSPELEKVVNEAIDDEVKEILFVMDGVDYMSSAGIRALLAFRKKVGEGNVTLQNINNSVREVLELSALLNYFIIC